MKLLAKKILIIGGNGYVGNYFGSRLVQQSAKVFALSRNGPKYEYPENKNITWIKGSILQPEPILQQLNCVDIIIHTLGVLVDTHVRKSTPIGGDGTYEQMNRDSFHMLLKSLKDKKKVIYLSSNGHPPFLERYLSTKHEAENLLFKSQHEGYSIRPGFVHNWDHRKWSAPLKSGIQIWNKIYPAFETVTAPSTTISNVLKQFKQGPPTALQDMGDALIKVCEQGYSKKIVQNQDINALSRKYHQQKKK